MARRMTQHLPAQGHRPSLGRPRQVKRRPKGRLGLATPARLSVSPLFFVFLALYNLWLPFRISGPPENPSLVLSFNSRLRIRPIFSTRRLQEAMVNPTSNGATAPPLRHRESRLNWPLKLGRSKKETAPQFVVQLDGSDSNSSPFPQAGKDGSGKAQAPSHRVEGLGLSETPSINTAGPVVGGAFQGLASNNSSTLSLGMTPRAKQHSRHGSAETTKGHSENPSPSAEQQESDISSLGGLLTRQTFRSLLEYVPFRCRSDITTPEC